MRLCPLIIAGLVAVSLVNCDRGGSPAVTKGQDGMKVVRFRQQGSAWTKSDGMTVERPDGYAVRKARGSAELIFAGLTAEGYWARHYGKAPTDEWYTRNRYAVSLDGEFQARPATEQESDEAAELPAGGRSLRPEEMPADETDGLNYRGKRLAKSGQYWLPPAALFSQSERWVALFSYSSPEKPRRPEEGPSLPFPTSSHPPAEAFLDVYDTSTGEKILAGHIPPSTTSLTSTLGATKALWVDDKYIVVPSDIALETCLVGVLPNH